MQPCIFALALTEGMNMERIKSAVNEYRKNVSEGGHSMPCKSAFTMYWGECETAIMHIKSKQSPVTYDT